MTSLCIWTTWAFLLVFITNDVLTKDVPFGTEFDFVEEFREEVESGPVHPMTGRRTKGKGPKVQEGPVDCNTQGRFGVPGDCAKFYICPRAGSHPIFGYCLDNKLFHHQKRRCLKISSDQCKESMCKTPTDKFPDPYSKENYLTCLRMAPELKSCPIGQIFNAVAEICVGGSPIDGLKSASEEDHTEEDDKKNPHESKIPVPPPNTHAAPNARSMAHFRKGTNHVDK